PEGRLSNRRANLLVRPADEIDGGAAGRRLDGAVDVAVPQVAVDPGDDVGCRVKERGPRVTDLRAREARRWRRSRHRLITSRVKQRVWTKFPSRQSTLELISTRRIAPSLQRSRAG